MNKDIKQWLVIYLIPYAVVGILTLGTGLILLPLGGTVGVIIGLSSTEPYFTSSFKMILITVLLLAILLFIVGFKFHEKLWGKILNAVGVYLWCVSGLIGFGPQ